MSATVLVRAGRRYYKVRVNPSDEVAKQAVKEAARHLIYTSEGAAVRAGEKSVQAGSLDLEIVEDMTNAVARHIAHSELASYMSAAQIDRIAALAIQRAWPKVCRVNPLVRSRSRKSIGKNIKYLLSHPGELTAKTPEMKRKQAIAIAMSVWRRKMGMPQYRRGRR
jgi:4-hydroxy-3-methylbut-2-en-1-yl diphosphate synthase IspG/GcpE